VAISNRFARVAPWALIGAALLMGAALLATVWTTNRGVRDASETLERGQGDVIQDAVRMRVATLDASPTKSDLADILAELGPEGLTYIAAFDRRGGLLAAAGEAVGKADGIEPGLLEERSRQPIAAGDRRRTVLRRPLGRHARRLEEAGLGAGGRHRLGPILLEFEPRIADDLRSDAGRTLAIGALAAGGLLLAALALFRWILYREVLERRLEHERRLASLGQMSATLAHEIRNPLASLKGNAQLLARALPEDERSRKKADRVVAEAMRLEALTNGLLEFARTGAIHREPADPAALLREAAAAVDEQRVAIDAAGAPPEWPLDRQRMRQVLINLIENAAEASAESAVEARVVAERDRLLFVVRDHGPGIAAEDLARIFEPFFSRRVQGTGLGLAVAKRLVELHGGTLTARNAPGGGAEFSITLPRLK
jgi:two-component system, NtrC family, sensor histidine kinase HydH